MKTNKLKLILAAGLFFSGFGISAFSQQDSKKEAKKENEKKFEDTNKKGDADFAVNAANDGMYEVQVSELAKMHASSTKVKELAEMMIKDHSKVNEELKMLAVKKNITLPSKINEKRQKDFDEFTKLTGADFDKKFTKGMVSDHKDAIDLFQKEADNGLDGELKAWAAGKITALKHHLSMSEEARDAVK